MNDAELSEYFALAEKEGHSGALVGKDAKRFAALDRKADEAQKSAYYMMVRQVTREDGPQSSGGQEGAEYA